MVNVIKWLLFRCFSSAIFFAHNGSLSPKSLTDIGRKLNGMKSINSTLNYSSLPLVNHTSRKVNLVYPTVENEQNDWKNVTLLQNVSSVHHPVVCDVKNYISFLANSSCYPPSAALQCFHDPIFCKKHFASGKRELQDERPTYGEYSSLKHQKWFHVIQHGGIAFLFHPCTSQKEVENLRKVASRCLHRYVLAPYSKLTQRLPIALVSWGCFYLSNKVHKLQMMSWIQKHAYSGPASHVHTNGKFKENLVKQSKVITDEKDAILCPSEEQRNLFTPTVPSTMKKVTFVRNPESIINNRIIKLSKLKPGVVITANITVTKVETGSALWAAGSLVFLCGILFGWLLYTRTWLNLPKEYKYDPLSNKDSFECGPGQSQFNLLKSSQKFMTTFRWKGDKKEDAVDKVSLIPISEVDDDEEVLFKR